MHDVAPPSGATASSFWMLGNLPDNVLPAGLCLVHTSEKGLKVPHREGSPIRKLHIAGCSLGVTASHKIQSAVGCCLASTFYSVWLAHSWSSREDVWMTCLQRCQLPAKTPTISIYPQPQACIL